MKILSAATLALILAVTVLSAGCTVRESLADPAPVPPSPVQQMDRLILQPEDMPVPVTVEERRTKNASEVSDLARDLGWKTGYVLRYRIAGDQTRGPVMLSHQIAIYPAAKMPRILGLVHDAASSQGEYAVTDLPDPGIGDMSFAVAAREVFLPDRSGEEPMVSRLPDLDLPGNSGRTTGGHPVYYEIVFVKGEVFEALRISGPSADYKLLLELAQEAYRKI